MANVRPLNPREFMAENVTPLLSKIPLPEKETDEAFARGVIEMVLNATLNRYVAALEDAGYKRQKICEQVKGAGLTNYIQIS